LLTDIREPDEAGQMKVRPGHRTLLSLLLAIALVGSIVASAFAVPARGVVNDPVLGAMSLCASDHQAEQKDGSPIGPDQNGHCVFCTLAIGVSLAIPLAAVAVVFPQASSRFIEFPSTSTLADHVRLGGIHSRGPPLLRV
jgi:hypothetical protein